MTLPREKWFVCRGILEPYRRVSVSKGPPTRFSALESVHRKRCVTSVVIWIVSCQSQYDDWIACPEGQTPDPRTITKAASVCLTSACSTCCYSQRRS